MYPEKREEEKGAYPRKKQIVSVANVKRGDGRMPLKPAAESERVDTRSPPRGIEMEN